MRPNPTLRCWNCQSEIRSGDTYHVNGRSVREAEAKGYLGLERRGMVLSNVGLIAPSADSLGGGGGQDRVSA